MKSSKHGVNIRVAGTEDIPVLALHHRKMFEEIWQKKGNQIDPEVLEQLEEAYSSKLREQFSDGTCTAWVIEGNNEIIASGAVTVICFVPTPVDLSHRLAYLHSMYTEKKYRGMQLAHTIIDHAMVFCKKNGIKRIILTASDAGRPIYHEIGFQPASDLMRFILE